MNRITNTSKNPNPEWLFGRNPNAIEEQEAEGQRQLIQSAQLPRKANHQGLDIKSHYEKMGIRIVSESQGDDLFFDVELPNGWKLKPTNHLMWSSLVNEKGEEVASIFYKAAFYDRSAFINFINL